MRIAGLYLIFGTICVLRLRLLEASYECGIRKHSFVPLIHHGWKVKEGQWPWHVALFHKMVDGPSEYACGGTLIDDKHIVTAAHCVRNRHTGYRLPATSIELHFGQQILSKMANHTQIRDVIKFHEHPEFSTHRNDIAVLVTKIAVEYTDYVIPICMDQKVDRNLRNLEGQRGWITGWGTTKSGNISDVLRTASMPVVDYVDCIREMPFGNLVNRNVFCAGDLNGTSPGTGDSGGGMYFSEGDRWVLRGIVSFGKADESKQRVDTYKYAVFVNVQQYLSWIKSITDETKSQVSRGRKRISEKECDRFKELAKQKSTGVCLNSRYPHTVLFTRSSGEFICSGVLVNENHVLTTCVCKGFLGVFGPAKVQIDTYHNIDIEESTCHPQFRPSFILGDHDLAVIKLKSSLTLYNRLIPTCLASNWTENLHDTLHQTGFGHHFDDIPRFIESDDNQIISDKECRYRITQTLLNNVITTNQLCAVNHDRNEARTFYSLGNPLQSANSRTCMYTTVGLLSTKGVLNHRKGKKGHIFEKEPEYYGAIDIYTRVSPYLDWIEGIVWKKPVKEHVKPPTTRTTTRAPPRSARPFTLFFTS